MPIKDCRCISGLLKFRQLVVRDQGHQTKSQRLSLAPLSRPAPVWRRLRCRRLSRFRQLFFEGKKVIDRWSISYYKCLYIWMVCLSFESRTAHGLLCLCCCHCFDLLDQWTDFQIGVNLTRFIRYVSSWKTCQTLWGIYNIFPFYKYIYCYWRLTHLKYLDV